jgi:hypothetical protein
MKILLLILFLNSIVLMGYDEVIRNALLRGKIIGDENAFIDVDSVATTHFVTDGNLVTTGTLDLTITNNTAAGERGINLNIAEDTIDLTGTLDAIYARATGFGADNSHGRVQGAEIGARLPHGDGTKAAGEVVAVYAWADTKIGDVGTLRVFEASLDGGAGGTATSAVAFEAFNNTSANYTTSIAYDVNEGSASGRAAYTYDMRMQNGALFANSTTDLLTITEATVAIAGKIMATKTTEQLRLGYDGNNYATWTVAADGALTLVTVDASAAEGDINLNPDGLVGIKTAVPAVELDVTGGIRATKTTEQLRLAYDATNYLTVTLADDGHTSVVTVDPDGAEADINFNPDGNVGIKTADPSTALEVTGTVTATTGFTDGTFTVDGSGNFSGVGTLTATGKISNVVITEQLRLGYDATNYVTWTVADDGGLAIATVDADAASADLTFNLDGDYLAIGGTAADNVTPELRIVNDADNDVSATTSETLTLALTPNGTPTNATWGFTSTQSAGYTFDKPINLGTSSNGIVATGTPDYITELYAEIPTGAQSLANVGAINCRTTIKAASDITSASHTTASYNRLEIEGGSTDLGFGWYNAVLGYVKNPSGTVDATESAVGAVMGLLNVGADWNAQSETINAAVIAGTYSPNTADIRKHYGFYVWKGGTLAFTHGLYIEASSATTAIGSGTVTNLLSLPAEGTAPVEAHVADENSTGRIKILINGEVRYLYYYD